MVKKEKVYTYEEISEFRDEIHDAVNDAVRLFSLAVEGRAIKADLETLQAIDSQLKQFVSLVAASINVSLRKTEENLK